MAGELALRGGGALKKAATKGALKKAAKKSALKKAAAKKGAAKKAPGKKAAAKKGAKHGGPHGDRKLNAMQARAFHHMQRSVALVSLLEQDSGGDLRVLLDEGLGAYEARAWERAEGLLRATEHIAMAGLYAARAEHRVAVEEPGSGEVEKEMDDVALRLENPRARRSSERIHAIAEELLTRAEAADDDLHVAWELVRAAAALCDGLNGTRE